MATKYGQEAIDYWNRKTAQTRAIVSTIMAIIMFAITYAVFIYANTTGDRSSFVGLAVFWVIVILLVVKGRAGRI